MLGFFVVPYPNETFYSLVARFCKRFNPINYGLRCLFGKAQTKIRTDLAATDLGSFQKLSSRIFGYTCEGIFNHFTLWPLYRKFLNLNLVENIDKTIKEGGKYVSRQLFSRSRNSGIVPYYCPSCNQEQREKGEELYWNRVHQIPNILVCPYHFTILEKAVLRSRDDSSNLFIPSELSCPIKTRKPSTNKFINDVSVTLKNLLLIPDYKLETHYKEKIQTLGYLKGERLDFTKLRIDFESVLGSHTIRLYESRKLRVFSKALIYNYKTFVSPISHAIFHAFLVEMNRQVNEKKPFLPFGKGPWKCINKCCPSYNKNVIRECQWKYQKLSKNFLGYFKCSCGFVYYHSLNSKTSKRKTRIVARGKLWEERAKALWKTGHSMSEISRKIGYTSSINILAIQKLLGSKKAAKKKISKIAIDPNRLKALRSSWRKAVEENINNQTLTIIRRKHPAVYEALARTDSPWLKAFNRPFRSKTKTRKKVLTKSSKEIEKLVANEIAMIKLKYPSEKITRTRISLALGISLTNEQISMPRFRQLLTKYPESSKKIAA